MAGGPKNKGAIGPRSSSMWIIVNLKLFAVFCSLGFLVLIVLSVSRMIFLDRYWGTLILIIFHTSNREWNSTNSSILSHPTASIKTQVFVLLSMPMTNLLASFITTCNFFRYFLYIPPYNGSRYNILLSNNPLISNTGCLPILESVTLKFNFSVIFYPMNEAVAWMGWRYWSWKGPLLTIGPYS